MTTQGNREIHLKLHAYQSRILDLYLETWGDPVWIVGGMIRDHLLGRAPGHDLDLVVPGPHPLEDSRWIPDNCHLFQLDARRHFWRLVSLTRNNDTTAWTVDLAALGGDSIEDDLGRRDFRVNAMAVRVHSVSGTRVDGTLIDPLGGRKDLSGKTLVPVSKHNLLADPVRMLRAVRLAHVLGLTPAPELRAFIRRHGHRAGLAARVRVGTEVWKLTTDPETSLQAVARDLDEMDLWPVVAGDRSRRFALAEYDVHWLARLQDWARSMARDRNRHARDPQPTGPQIDVAVDLHQMACTPMGPGRLRADWWVMAAVLWLLFRDGSAANTGAGMRRWAQRCAFATAEQRWLGSVGAVLDQVWHTWVHPPARVKARAPTVLDCHRLMAKTGWHGGWPALQDACVIAAPLARETDGEAPTRLASIQGFVSHLWRLGRAGPVRPLATGQDILTWYDLAPGPKVGRLLALLVEAQVGGRVTTRDQARRFLDALL